MVALSNSCSNIVSSVCPTCQLPLHLLTKPGSGVSASSHVADCRNQSRGGLKQCPMGERCDSNVIPHFARYLHLPRQVIDLTPEKSDDDDDDEPLVKSPVEPEISMVIGDSILNEASKPQFHSTKVESGSLLALPGPSQPSSKIRKPYYSPIKAIRRSSQTPSNTCKDCGNSFQGEALLRNHLCVRRVNTTVVSKQDSDYVTPDNSLVSGESSPLVKTDRQRKFLNDLALADDVKKDLKNVEDADELVGEKEKNDVGAKVEDDDRVRFSSQESQDMFNESLGTQIDNIVEQLRTENEKHDHSVVDNKGDEAVPDNNEVSKPSSRAKVVVKGKELDISLEPTDDENEENKVTKIDDNAQSPFKISAERDSEELEISLRIDPTVHCKRVRLKVPLKQSNSGNDLPINISANYSEVTSPVKQTAITEFFTTNANKRDEPRPGPSAKEQWKNLFSKKNKKDYVVTEYHSSQEEKSKDTTKKKPPFFKIIQGTSLAVDAFCYGDLPGVQYYLLSHFHYDHYHGLSRTWSKRIVCTPVTKRLLLSKLKVQESLIITISVDETLKLGECLVTALEANHCPGAVMFLIKTPVSTILHTGDFRACHEMESYPELWNKVDKLYLDTTYCRPEYDFPSQHDVIERTVKLVQEFISAHPNTVLMVGAYCIGKERIFKAIAAALDCKVWGDSVRVNTWKCLEDGDILKRLVEDRRRAQVQVIQNQNIIPGKLGLEFDKLRAGSRWSHVLGVRPSGWSHCRGQTAESSLMNIKIVSHGEISVLEVPYSEHSSFSEMKRFVQFLSLDSHKDIIDTVSKSKKDNERTREIFRAWVGK